MPRRSQNTPKVQQKLKAKKILESKIKKNTIPIKHKEKVASPGGTIKKRLRKKSNITAREFIPKENAVIVNFAQEDPPIKEPIIKDIVLESNDTDPINLEEMLNEIVELQSTNNLEEFKAQRSAVQEALLEYANAEDQVGDSVPGSKNMHFVVSKEKLQSSSSSTSPLSKNETHPYSNLFITSCVPICTSMPLRIEPEENSIVTEINNVIVLPLNDQSHTQNKNLNFYDCNIDILDISNYNILTFPR